MKKVFLFASAAVALLATGCSNDLVPNGSDIENGGKEKIVLASGESNAALTTRAGFESDTRIVARYVADSRIGGTSAKCVTTELTAKSDATQNNVSYSNVEYVESKVRYWEDAHARNSILSVYAVAVPNKDNVALTLTGSDTWSTSNVDANTILWTLTTAQTAESIAKEDLTYSNNIQQTGKKGVYIWADGAYPVGPENAKEHSYTDNEGTKTDGRLYYTDGNALTTDASSSSAGHYDRGQLEFHHSLSRIKINIVKGDGFSSTSPFTFANGTNIKVNGMVVTGIFDVKTGTWTSKGDATNLSKIAKIDNGTTAAGTYVAQMLPGYVFDASATNTLEFTIDGNSFLINKGQLLKALKDNSVNNGINADATSVTMEQEKEYVFTIKVSKTKIQNITATVAPWTKVEAEEIEPKINISQVYGHLSSGDECTDFTEKFALYLSTSKTSNYSKGTDVTYADSKYTMDTQLYWPNHETHYFFRGVYPSTVSVTDNSYIAVESGAYNNTTAPSNLMIGYPRKIDGTPDETCKVHTSPVTQGICATEGDIRMNFQYVMSQVEVKLVSNPTAVGKEETAKVTLNEKATIEILGGYKSGSIKLEDGTAAYTASDKGTYTMLGTVTGNAYDRHDAVIPQLLSGLKFRVKVDGGNGTFDYYEANIADILVGGSAISSWEPGKHYTYTLNITKTGIKITATLKDWETTKGSTNIWM